MMYELFLLICYACPQGTLEQVRQALQQPPEWLPLQPLHDDVSDGCSDSGGDRATAESCRPTAESCRPTTESCRPTAESCRPTSKSCRPTAELEHDSARPIAPVPFNLNAILFSVVLRSHQKVIAKSSTKEALMTTLADALHTALQDDRIEAADDETSFFRHCSKLHNELVQYPQPQLRASAPSKRRMHTCTSERACTNDRCCGAHKASRQRAEPSNLSEPYGMRASE